MKRLLSIIAVMLLVTGAAALAQEKPAMDLPVYPGGEVTMEINMGNEDILPMLKAMLPLLSSKMGKIIDKVSPEDIAAVLKDVTRIEFLQVDVTKSGVAETDITGYYGKNLPGGTWNRVFWQSMPKAGTIAIYSQGVGEGLYGFRVQSTSVESKPVKRVQIVKLQGKIDYVKLLELAGKVVTQPS